MTRLELALFCHPVKLLEESVELIFDLVVILQRCKEFKDIS